MRYKRNLGWGDGNGEIMYLQYFFYIKTFFGATELKRGKQKIGVRVGEKGCVYIKECFKPFFAIFKLDSPLYFLIPMVDNAPPSKKN